MMFPLRHFFFGSLLLGTWAIASTRPVAASDDEAPAPAPPQRANDCVQHTTSVRYVMGYDHLVHLESRCEKSVRCVVHTNVTSETVEAVLPPGGKDTVVTFRGSPAREFEATVNCSFSE